MDTDIILVRPINTLSKNTIAWEDSTGQVLNGAFSRFEKGNPFLEACLKDFVRNYRADIWAQNCPYLLTRVYKASEWSEDVVKIVDYKLFYMIAGRDMHQHCFVDTEGPRFDSNMQTLKNEAYVVPMNSKIPGHLG